MKKTVLYNVIVVLGCLSAIYSCGKEDVRLEYKTDYKIEPKTETGIKLVQQTDLFGHIFSDSTYTVTNGVNATEI